MNRILEGLSPGVPGGDLVDSLGGGGYCDLVSVGGGGGYCDLVSGGGGGYCDLVSVGGAGYVLGGG